MNRIAYYLLLTAGSFACNKTPDLASDKSVRIAQDQPATGKKDSCSKSLVTYWKAFRADENDTTFNTVYNCLPETEVSIEDTTLISSEFSNIIVNEFSLIEQKIAQGNKYYINIAFKLYSILGAAYSEELDIMLGQLIKIKPELFLEGAKKHRNLISLSHISGNFGPAIYEDSIKSIQETQDRIEALNKVHRKDLESIKQEVLTTLQNSK